MPRPWPMEALARPLTWMLQTRSMFSFRMDGMWVESLRFGTKGHSSSFALMVPSFWSQTVLTTFLSSPPPYSGPPVHRSLLINASPPPLCTLPLPLPPFFFPHSATYLESTNEGFLFGLKQWNTSLPVSALRSLNCLSILSALQHPKSSS